MQMSVNHSNVLIPWSEGKLCFWGSCQHHLHVHLHDFCQSLFCSRHSWEPFWGEKGEPSVPENYFHNNFINSQGNLFFLSLLSPVHYVNTKFLKWWQELSRNAWNIHTTNSSQHRDGTGSLLAHISQGIFNGRSVRGKLNSQALNPNKKPWLFIFLVK